VSDALVEAIVARATEVESGARAIDQIIRRGLLPAIATEILSRMADGGALAGLVLDVGPDGRFVFGSGGSDEAAAETDAEAPARGDAADADATEPTAAVA
jgi:type VI secretion system protein VasG